MTSTPLTGDAARAELRAYANARLRKWTYGNAWNNVTDLDNRASSDCSDWTDALYTHLGYPLPGMSYQQATQGTYVHTWTGARGAAPAVFASLVSQGVLLGGELVCMALDKSRPAMISHTEAYDQGFMSYGHGGPGPGPTYHRIDQDGLLDYANRFTVRRIIHESAPATIETPHEENDMLIIKSPNRPAALAGPGTFHVLRNSEELAVTLDVIAPTIRDTLNDRQYDVTRAVIIAGALDAQDTKAQLADIYAALDKEQA